MIKRFINTKYINLKINISKNNIATVTVNTTVTGALDDLYKTNIEDKEKKLEYIVNMVFPNGTMFETYNTSENVKKEFNMYIKNYISLPEYKNATTYTRFVYDLFVGFKADIVYKLFTNLFMLKVGY